MGMRLVALLNSSASGLTRDIGVGDARVFGDLAEDILAVDRL